MELQTYGKQKLHERVYTQVRDRFTITPAMRLGPHELYIPKLNKARFSLGILGAAFFIAVPLITPLAIPCVLWGIK